MLWDTVIARITIALLAVTNIVATTPLGTGNPESISVVFMVHYVIDIAISLHNCPHHIEQT